MNVIKGIISKINDFILQKIIIPFLKRRKLGVVPHVEPTPEAQVNPVSRAQELIQYMERPTTDQEWEPTRLKNIAQMHLLKKYVGPMLFDVEAVEEHNANLDSSNPTFSQLIGNEGKINTLYQLKSDEREKFMKNKAKAVWSTRLTPEDLNHNYAH